MKYIDWNEQNNAQLWEERGVCFEDVLSAIDSDNLLDDLPHPDQKRYPGQRILVITIDNYAYVIPCVKDETKYFLKTIYPSRIFTKYYITRRQR